VTDLVPSRSNKKYQTVRVPLPEYVTSMLSSIYAAANLKKGCPDLVLWNTKRKTVRFVEVKCPHWDSPTSEQNVFLKAAKSLGANGKIVEWEFTD